MIITQQNSQKLHMYNYDRDPLPPSPSTHLSSYDIISTRHWLRRHNRVITTFHTYQIVTSSPQRYTSPALLTCLTHWEPPPLTWIWQPAWRGAAWTPVIGQSSCWPRPRPSVGRRVTRLPRHFLRLLRFPCLVSAWRSDSRRRSWTCSFGLWWHKTGHADGPVQNCWFKCIEIV